MDNQPATISSKRQGSRLLNCPLMEKNGATIASINNDMEATQKQNTQPKKEHFFRGSQIMHTLLAITCQMTMQKCFHMGNLKECGVTTKLKLRRNEAWCCYSYACRIVPDIWFVRHQGAFVRCKICTSYQMRILSLAVLKNASNWKCCVSTENHWPIF